jgi:hypothetical protein
MNKDLPFIAKESALGHSFLTSQPSNKSLGSQKRSVKEYLKSEINFQSNDIADSSSKLNNSSVKNSWDALSK